jgi:hypothetical protein
MALPIILAFMARMGLKYGGAKAIQMAIKKYGKKAVAKATNKMTYVGKNVAKKTKVKTYKDTKAHKATLKIRAALKGRKISTDFGKALDYTYKTATKGIRGRKPTKKKP